MNYELKAVALALLMVSCQKIPAGMGIDAMGDDTGEDADANVTLVAPAAVTEELGRLDVSLYDEDGKRLRTVNQQSTTAGYGTIALALSEGNYRVVAVAHNGVEKAAMAHAEKITFASNKMTDTFCYTTLLSVGEDGVTERLALRRVVAKVVFRFTDDLQAKGVAQLKFYYTGGSSTLDALTGRGCVNSRQTELRTVTDQTTAYELYTMPHSDEGKLKITVTALTAEGTTLLTRTYENVPVKVNNVTEWQGSLWDAAPTDRYIIKRIGIDLDTEWEGVIEVNGNGNGNVNG